MFLPDEDRHTYAEGLRPGGYLVPVRTSEAHYERALRHPRRRRQTPQGTGAASSSSPAAAPSGSREEIIPMTEEQLRVGKRDVSHGRVRIRSYVVETPVEEQVGLREERVNVERRPVDRRVSGDDNLFRERTIEAEERPKSP